MTRMSASRLQENLGDALKAVSHVKRLVIRRGKMEIAAESRYSRWLSLPRGNPLLDKALENRGLVFVRSLDNASLSDLGSEFLRSNERENVRFEPSPNHETLGPQCGPRLLSHPQRPVVIG